MCIPMNDDKKALIRQVFDIDLNSDLFDPRYDKDERERLAYESQLIYELDQRSSERSAENRAKREVAKTLKLDGFPPEAISKSTGVPLDEVIAL